MNNSRPRNRASGHLTLTVRHQSPEVASALRRTGATIVPCLFAMVVAAGCASTTVANRQERMTP